MFISSVFKAVSKIMTNYEEQMNSFYWSTPILESMLRVNLSAIGRYE